MELHLKVIEMLKAEGISAKIDGNDFKTIYWLKDDIRHYIYESDMAEGKESLAWLQSSDGDDHLLVVYDGGERFSWEPETYNPAFGCECIYIGWRKNYLVFIYLEKHDIYICTISNNTVSTLNFYGRNICVSAEVVSYSSFEDNDSGIVNMVSLDNLEVVEKVDIETALKCGLKPLYYQELIQ